MARELRKATSLRESYNARVTPLLECYTLDPVMEEERTPLWKNGRASSVTQSQREEDRQQRVNSSSGRPTASRRTVTINCDPEYQQKARQRFTQSGYSMTFDGASSGEFVSIEVRNRWWCGDRGGALPCMVLYQCCIT